MAAVDTTDDGDLMAEDECTMDFGEEEETSAHALPAGVSRAVAASWPQFREYPGSEDFSKYLSETGAAAEPAPDYENGDEQLQPAATGTRMYKKNAAKGTIGRLSRNMRSSTAPTADNTYESVTDIDAEQSTNTLTSALTDLPPMFPAPPSPPSSPTLSVRRKSVDAIRDRLNRFLTTLGRSPGQSRRGRSKDWASGMRPGLQTFTYADSKIGSMMLAQQQQEQLAAEPVDEPETQSDLGAHPRSGQTWWDVGTLSSNRGGEGYGDKSRRHRGRRQRDKSSSEPDLSRSDDEKQDGGNGWFGRRSSKTRDAVAVSSSASSSLPPQPASTGPEDPSTPPALPPVRSREPQDPDQSRRSNPLRRLVDGLGQQRSAGGQQHQTHTRRKRSEFVDDQTNSRTYEEIPVRL